MEELILCLNEACSKDIASVINDKSIGKTRLKRWETVRPEPVLFNGTPLARVYPQYERKKYGINY